MWLTTHLETQYLHDRATSRSDYILPQKLLQEMVKSRGVYTPRDVKPHSANCLKKLTSPAQTSQKIATSQADTTKKELWKIQNKSWYNIRL